MERYIKAHLSFLICILITMLYCIGVLIYRITTGNNIVTSICLLFMGGAFSAILVMDIVDTLQDLKKERREREKLQKLNEYLEWQQEKDGERYEQRTAD